MLREQVTRLALEDSVRFVGRISDSDLVNSYRTADLVVMPSQALEGFGLTTAEALACGTPVVGTPIGATPELLAGIDPALVAADATPEGIAAAVVDVLSDSGRIAAIRRKLGEAVAGELSWRSVAPRYLEEYRQFSAALARTLMSDRSSSLVLRRPRQLPEVVHVAPVMFEEGTRGGGERYPAGARARNGASCRHAACHLRQPSALLGRRGTRSQGTAHARALRW